MLTILIIFSPVFIFSFLLTRFLIDKKIFRRTYNSNLFFGHKLNKLKSYLLKGDYKKKRLFVIITTSLFITSLLFFAVSLLVLSNFKGFVQALFTIGIFAFFTYIIGWKFIKSLSYQMFEKNND